MRRTRILSRPAVWGIWVPLVLLGVLTCWFRVTSVDLAVSRLFYGGSGQWPLRYCEPFHSLYRFGTLPGSTLATIGLGLGFLGTIWARLRRWRNVGYFLAIAFMICPLLLVDLFFKPCWGRPRPIQLQQFGGRHSFVPIGSFGPSTRTRSFPSSHAAAGFYLMVPAFVLWRRRKSWAIAVSLMGIIYGGIVGLARIVQGAHFPSDVVWSFVLVYFSGLLLAAAFGYLKIQDDPLQLGGRHRSGQTVFAAKYPPRGLNSMESSSASEE